MISGMLVDATDLETWANRRNTQGMLPQVVRRLVHATSHGIARSGFRAGEGVQLAGWDGVVHVQEGNAFVPAGLSVWELSTDRRSTAKANDDYEKRSENTLGVDPSEATFVFATARRWVGKDSWATERRNERRWRDVRAYDADDLWQWLETAPAVHVWLSIQLGKHPTAAEDLNTYWENWTAATNPEIPPDVVLAGREAVSLAVHNWIDSADTLLQLRGESRAESVAVFAAAVEKLDPEKREGALSRTILIHDADSWAHLVASTDRLILVPDFECDSVAVASAIRNGHSVVYPSCLSDGEEPNVVQVPPLSREKVEKLLIEAGVNEGRARDLSAIARRSLISLRRQISIISGIERPTWARPVNARSLLPALLAGRWSSDVEGDQQVLATLARESYDNVSSNIVRWSNEDDPPVRCIGTTWYLTSAEDAWLLLGRFLTADDLDRFQTIAIDVLTRHDPAFDLPDDQRWMAGVIGPRPQHSGLLRTGVAHTLAILGARGHSIRIAGGSTLDGYARPPVQALLSSDDWRVWASLPLGLLAEASPDDFLDAVDRGVSGDQPFLLGLFRDKEADIFASAPHTGLLFALESLAWNEEFLTQVSTALAKLARIDPGGRWANRPLASLRSIFLFWLPQTTASMERRFRAIDSIREREPGIAWKAMMSLMPQHVDHSSPTSRPRWREWAPPNDVRVTTIERANALRELVQRMLGDAGTVGSRWADLIEAMPQLPCDQYFAVVTKLESLDSGQMAPDDLADLWNALRTLISRHRSFRDADSSLPVEDVDRLAVILPQFEPRTPLHRYGWLFGNTPSLPEGREEHWEAYEHAIATRQCDAIRALHQQSGLGWVSDFVEHVERPEQLGAAFARSEIVEAVADDLLRKHLRPEDPLHHAFMGGFVWAMVRNAGLEWAREKLKTTGAEWLPVQRSAFCVCLPFNADTWELVDGFDDGTLAEYWKRVAPPIHVDGDVIDTVIRRLVEHDRPVVAAVLLQDHMRDSDLSAELVVDVLDRLAIGAVDETDVRRLSAHDLSDLLSYVSEADGVEESRVAKLEWAFLPALGRHCYTPKVLHREMARNPEFFDQVITLVYRDEGETPNEPSDEDKARAKRAYELLQSWRWRPLPGMPDDGTFDPSALREWVLEARTILQPHGRLAMGDYTIGEILSSSPAGDDGVWPHPAVRDLIEELASEQFEKGLVVGVLNSEGVSSRNPNEGGTRERDTANRYGQWAGAVGDRWGRTAAMLRRLRDIYCSRANAENQRAIFREEFD